MWGTSFLHLKVFWNGCYLDLVIRVRSSMTVWYRWQRFRWDKLFVCFLLMLKRTCGVLALASGYRRLDKLYQPTKSTFWINHRTGAIDVWQKIRKTMTQSSTLHPINISSHCLKILSFNYFHFLWLDKISIPFSILDLCFLRIGKYENVILITQR